MTLHKEIRQCKVGKKTSDALYIHISAFHFLTPALKEILDQKRAAAKQHFNIDSVNIIKIEKSGRTVSFLQYDNFDVDPHPALTKSIVVKWSGLVRIKNYAGNPPVLHRKELFVHESYPLYNEFKKLTQKEKALGLLGRRDIGLKNSWEKVVGPFKKELGL